MENEIISVGIDIGTTTTQLVFSKITIENTSNPFIVPDIKITNKEIIYRSKIYFTPLLSNCIIDLKKIKKIIMDEYKEAKVNKRDISTGAVIITGETSRKENAEEVLQVLSEFAGDFVVATAGADLEGILAGHGAGASELSKNKMNKVINFDIGGGTTNAVIFDNGEIIDTFALDIGGRLIKIDFDGNVIYISERIQHIIDRLELNINLDSIPNLSELKKLTDYFAENFYKINNQYKLDNNIKKLFIEHGHKEIKSDKVMFSGGVAEFIYNKNYKPTFESLLDYGDIGPLLGYSIQKKFNDETEILCEPKEKIRATVIGAGSHSTKISGSTIFYDDTILPVKNIPIAKIVLNPENISAIYLKIEEKLSIYDYNPIALYLEGLTSPTYLQLKTIAKFIVGAFEDKNLPIIIIVENDFAKALGQIISNKLKSNKNIISIDKIKVDEGNYIDIGSPISEILPVVVKTLIFKS